MFGRQLPLWRKIKNGKCCLDVIKYCKKIIDNSCFIVVDHLTNKLLTFHRVYKRFSWYPGISLPCLFFYWLKLQTQLNYSLVHVFIFALGWQVLFQLRESRNTCSLILFSRMKHLHHFPSVTSLTKVPEAIRAQHLHCWWQLFTWLLLTLQIESFQYQREKTFLSDYLAATQVNGTVFYHFWQNEIKSL